MRYHFTNSEYNKSKIYSDSELLIYFFMIKVYNLHPTQYPKKASSATQIAKILPTMYPNDINPNMYDNDISKEHIKPIFAAKIV